MTTFTATRGRGRVPAAGSGYGGNQLTLYGHINVAANPADGDIYQMVYTPKNFLCYKAEFIADDIDTGTESLDMDLGWAANGGASETYRTRAGELYTNAAGSADPDGLINMGVLTGDAVTGVHVGGVLRVGLYGKPLFFSRETLIQVEANAAANSFTAGDMAVYLHGIII